MHLWKPGLIVGKSTCQIDHQLHCKDGVCDSKDVSRAGEHLASDGVVGSEALLEGAALRAAVAVAQVLKWRAAPKNIPLVRGNLPT